MSAPPQPEPLLAITNCDAYEGQILALRLAAHLEGCFGVAVDETGTLVNVRGDTMGTDTSMTTTVASEDNTHKHKTKNKPKRPRPQIVCLARDLTKCTSLQNCRFVKLVQISFDKPDIIAVALRGIKSVVLVPTMEENQVDMAHQLLDIMAKEQVIRCILISAIGTDAPEKGHLNNYRRIEEKVESTMQRWTILRQGFLFECLFYWIPMVQNQGIIGMPIGPEFEFTPLHIGNLGDALVSVTFPSTDNDGDGHGNIRGHMVNDGVGDMNSAMMQSTATPKLIKTLRHIPLTSERFDRQTYTLTGPQRMTGPKLVEQLNQALKNRPETSDKASTKHNEECHNNSNLATPVTYKTITRDECKTYLFSLRETNMPPKDDSPGFFVSISRVFDRQRHMWDMSALFKSLKGVSENPVGQNRQDMVGDETGARKDSMIPSKGSEPHVEPPNNTEVEMLLDLMDYINEGKASFLSGDFEKITGHQGMGPEKFFEKHGPEFRQRPPNDA
ncbi:hypothetical protein BGZ94_009642 [Podila epigama]|nr:hypothetical protein BGZ94_009642 [Podila epigama]